METYTVQLQPWQTSDVVIVVNSEQDAEHALFPKSIEFKITEVWDDSYGWMNNKVGGNADTNFGGIAEVYLYGNPGDAPTYYEPLEEQSSSRSTSQRKPFVLLMTMRRGPLTGGSSGSLTVKPCTWGTAP